MKKINWTLVGVWLIAALYLVNTIRNFLHLDH